MVTSHADGQDGIFDLRFFELSVFLDCLETPFSIYDRLRSGGNIIFYTATVFYSILREGLG